MVDFTKFKNELETLGEKAVREKMAHHYWSPIPSKESFALYWLSCIDKERDIEASLRRDAREEETLSIAKEANSIASSALIASRQQARYAMYAAIVATTALIISSIDLIKTALRYFF